MEAVAKKPKKTTKRVLYWYQVGETTIEMLPDPENELYYEILNHSFTGRTYDVVEIKELYKRCQKMKVMKLHTVEVD
jgi:hypothetical protein